MDIVTLIGYLITPLTGAIGWIFGRRQRRNTAIQSLQETIQLLSSTIQDDNQKIVSLMKDQLKVIIPFRLSRAAPAPYRPLACIAGHSRDYTCI